MKLAASAFLLAAAATARAQTAPLPAPAPAAPEEPTTPKEPPVQWGIGARFRLVFMPQFILQGFFAHATPMRSVGFGAEAIRRKGHFDIVISGEYDDVSPADGLYEEKGQTPNTESQFPDYVKFDHFSLLSFDVSFIWHVDLADFIQFRVGAGLGLGAVLGHFTQTDARCDTATTNDDLDDPMTSHCVPVPGSSKIGDKPPIVPVVNSLIGLRFKIGDDLSANVEVGFRDVFFTGIGLGYFF
jgi:hypothetical protein